MQNGFFIYLVQYWNNFCLYWFCTFLLRSSSTIKLFRVFWISWPIVIKKASRRKLAGQYRTSQLGTNDRFRYRLF